MTSVCTIFQLGKFHTVTATVTSVTCDLKKSCSFHRELSNGMSHALWRQVNRVDSWLFLVWSQIGSLTPDPSFGHNLCFKCPNEQWEPILDIYVPRAFQWYKERHKPLSFDPWNCSLRFRESTRTPSLKVGVALVVWMFIPSHSLTLPHIFLHSREYVMWLPGFLLVRTLAASLPWLLSFLLARNLATLLPWSRAQR
jgi:hypothetical protein